MSYWQSIMGAAQIYASRRNSRQLANLRNNQFAGGETAGTKADRYGRLASQLSQVKNTTKEQVDGGEQVDSGTYKPEIVDSSQKDPNERAWWEY